MLPIIFYIFISNNHSQKSNESSDNNRDIEKSETLLAPIDGPSVDLLSHGDLKVTSDGHYLVHEDGTPFFFMADTAWQLFTRVNKENTEMYLENRRQKGYTVIQAVAMASFEGTYEENQYGQGAMINEEVSQPNEEYYKHVDWVIKKAEEKGMIVALLPVWAKHDITSDSGKFNPNYQNQGIEEAKKKAFDFGLYLGKRYKDYRNIIWVLGGDTNPPGFEEIYRSMAKGLDQGDNGRHLMTYHPQYMNNYFHQESWLDFNMAQTNHVFDSPNYKDMLENYQLKPTKPTIDGEPRYEDIPHDYDPSNERMTDFDVRQAQYWALFSGAFGIVYGNNNVWQMYDSKYTPWIGADIFWYDALDCPGAIQMTYIRNLMESRPFLNRIPDQSLITSSQRTDARHIVSTRSSDGSYAFVYSPYGGTFSVDMSKISGNSVTSHWFNPKTGEATLIGTYPNDGTRRFKAPGSGRGNDWVLVLDDATKGFGTPGEVSRTDKPM